MSREGIEVSIGEVVFDPVEQAGPADQSDFIYVDISSIDRERKTIEAAKAIPAAKAPSRAKQRLKAGDVLVSMTRPNLNAVAIVPPSLDAAIGSTGFHVLRSKWIEPQFLYYLVQSRQFVEAMSGLVQGALYPAVRPTDINSFKFLLTGRAQQKRVSEKIEELLSDLDAGVAELKAAQKKLARYRQSLLKAAVEGTLTAEWRAERARRGEVTESGEQLLMRILAERRKRWEAKQVARFKEQGKAPPKDWKDKYSEPTTPVTAGLPTLPNGWVWASLGQLLESLTSGSRDWAPYYDKGTCTFVMAQNVRPWRPDFSFRQLVDPPEGDRDRVRSEVKKDDLLITIVGANTGQSCRVSEHLDSHFVCQSVALLRLVDTAISEYVNAVLNSEGHGQRQFREMNYGAGRPHLSFEQLESVFVPLPPLTEQSEILEKVDMSLSNMRQIELQMSVSKARCNAQRENILKAAFSGQLVPQDPKDEPASMLLKRIRAERARSEAPSRTPPRKTQGSRAA